ncbi:MAG: hypothetical protein Q4G68_10535 [Planctomycetia bacterium]|nr:hypothetical protein [Planctomycetia bacterium]
MFGSTLISREVPWMRGDAGRVAFDVERELIFRSFRMRTKYESGGEAYPSVEQKRG